MDECKAPAQWLLFALVADRLIFFDNSDAKYDWMDYFEAWFGEEAPGRAYTRPLFGST